MNTKISTGPIRPIIEDFAKEIKSKAEKGSHPEKAVIEFRNDRIRGKDGERDVYLVPIHLLRYRKDNGRIASDITSYEKMHGTLNETLVESQIIIKKFLWEKDLVNNEKLKKSIEHSGQIEPAIITCDGFLINGNRRKMILELLKKETLKVVILPGKDDEGGPPTLKEIEQIENKYQLQKDGKSEYTNFDRAISMKRKIDAGISLEDQLRDDPTNVGLKDKEFKKEVQNHIDQYLGPLECIDRYLSDLKRDNLYDNISEGRNDREGRWYSFIEYYTVYKQLRDEKKQIELGIDELEAGKIEDIAFKIIRKKDFPDNLKLMQVIRTIPKILKNSDAKKEFLKIGREAQDLKNTEVNDNEDFKTIDKKWGNKNASIIISHVKKAIQIIEYNTKIETPLTLLNDSLKKLNHENMDPISLHPTKYKEAFELTKQIQIRANELEKSLWNVLKLSDNYKITKIK